MKLDNLTPLYKSMKLQDIDRYKFELKLEKAVFDVFFFIDDSPYLLLFGVKAEKFSFEIKVMNGFIIDHRLDSKTYKRLCKVLGLTYDPDQKFSPWKFFTKFNANIPKNASSQHRAKPHDIALYRNIAEEAEKVYFIGWRDNKKWGTNVQESNLGKTKELLGKKAYLRCKQKNISSCWTDKKEAEIEFTLLELGSL